MGKLLRTSQLDKNDLRGKILITGAWIISFLLFLEAMTDWCDMPPKMKIMILQTYVKHSVRYIMDVIDSENTSIG